MLEQPTPTKQLFIDSGAFSAWNNDAIINLDDYIHFCKSHINDIDIVANLDVIPGKPFQKLTKTDIEFSAKQGWSNYKKMLRAGIPAEKLIHIFHQGEEFKWLKRLVNYGTYIGLSPANDKTTSQKKDWLDRCMEYVTDAEGFPIVKFHGFAVTSVTLMLRYPWFSVDSASWAATSRMGGIIIPVYYGKKWDFSKNPWIIGLTRKSPHKNSKLKHFDHLPPNIKQIALTYINETGYVLGSSKLCTVDETYKLKKGVEYWHTKPTIIEKVIETGLSNNHQMRNEINIIFFQNVVKQVPKWPKHNFTFKRKNRFF